MKRVLYVEDDPINAFVIRRLLADDFRVEHVEDGAGCLHLLEKENFDLILMDINLGRDKMDGIQTLKKIRLNPHHQSVPVVALTAYAMPGDKERFLHEGFDGYLSKPVEHKSLIAYVQKLVQAH